MQQYEACKDQFDRDGFCVIRSFLNAGQRDRVVQAAERLVTEIAPGLPPEVVYYEDKLRPDTLKQISHLEQHDPFFAELLADAEVVGLAERLLDGPVVPKGIQWFNKPPGIGQCTPAHQDGYFFMIDPPEAVTMWLSLDVVDEENGCVRYLPGSHRQGMRRHARTQMLGFSQAIVDYGSDDYAQEVPVCTQPGDLIVHHAMTVHRADANTSARTRKAIGVNFYSTRAKEDLERREAYRRMLDADLAAAGKI